MLFFSSQALWLFDQTGGRLEEPVACGGSQHPPVSRVHLYGLDDDPEAKLLASDVLPDSLWLCPDHFRDGKWYNQGRKSIFSFRRKDGRLLSVEGYKIDQKGVVRHASLFPDGNGVVTFEQKEKRAAANKVRMSAQRTGHIKFSLSDCLPPVPFIRSENSDIDFTYANESRAAAQAASEGAR